VLGLDLSLRATGVCILDGTPGSEVPESIWTALYPQPQVKGVEADVRRLIAITELVLDLIRKEKPDHIIIEAPAKNQQWQAARIGELHGVIKVQIFLATGAIPMVKEAGHMRKAVVGTLHKVQVTVVDAKGKTKKHWSYGTIPGKRGGTKKATIKDAVEFLLRKNGLEFPSQDEMDAYVTAKYCWNSLVPSAKRSVDGEEKTKNERAQSGANKRIRRG